MRSKCHSSINERIHPVSSRCTSICQGVIAIRVPGPCGVEIRTAPCNRFRCAGKELAFISCTRASASSMVWLTLCQSTVPSSCRCAGFAGLLAVDVTCEKGRESPSNTKLRSYLKYKSVETRSENGCGWDQLLARSAQHKAALGEHPTRRRGD